MRDALAADFRAAGWTVTFANPRTAMGFGEFAASCNAMIVVAPEFGNRLTDLVDEARACGATVWAAEESALIDCTHKARTCNTLRFAGIRTPRDLLLNADVYPRVLKPDDGAGSTDTHLVFGPTAMDKLLADDPIRQSYIQQEYIPGLAVSAAFLIGPGGTIPLPACSQNLSSDGRFRYLGGETPLDPMLAERAESLARRAIDAIDGLAGFVGVDLVLGERDVVIEINARLCTSYLGLRQLCDGNLATAWAAVARGNRPQS